MELQLLYQHGGADSNDEKAQGEEHPSGTKLLAAVAVTMVFLHDAKVPLFTGGFLGIDMLFVLYGYMVLGPMLSDLMAAARSCATGRRPSERLTPLIRAVGPHIAGHVRRIVLPGALCLATLALALFVPALCRSLAHTPATTSSSTLTASTADSMPWTRLACSGCAAQFDGVFVSALHYAGGASTFGSVVQHYWAVSLAGQMLLGTAVLAVLVTWMMPSSVAGAVVDVLAVVFIGVSVTLMFVIPDHAAIITRGWEFVVGAVIHIAALSLAPRMYALYDRFPRAVSAVAWSLYAITLANICLLCMIPYGSVGDFVPDPTAVVDPERHFDRRLVPVVVLAQGVVLLGVLTTRQTPAPPRCGRLRPAMSRAAAIWVAAVGVAAESAAVAYLVGWPILKILAAAAFVREQGDNTANGPSRTGLVCTAALMVIAVASIAYPVARACRRWIAGKQYASAWSFWVIIFAACTVVPAILSVAGLQRELSAHTSSCQTDGPIVGRDNVSVINLPERYIPAGCGIAARNAYECVCHPCNTTEAATRNESQIELVLGSGGKVELIGAPGLDAGPRYPWQDPEQTPSVLTSGMLARIDDGWPAPWYSRNPDDMQWVHHDQRSNTSAIVIVGDSHAMQLRLPLKEYAAKMGVSLAVSTGSCGMPNFLSCIRRTIPDSVRRYTNVLVLLWGLVVPNGYTIASTYKEAIDWWSTNLGGCTTVFADTPEWRHLTVPPTCLRTVANGPGVGASIAHCGASVAAAAPQLDVTWFLEYLRDIPSRAARTDMISINDLVCWDGTCYPNIYNISTYNDRNHLSDQFIRATAHIWIERIARSTCGARFLRTHKLLLSSPSQST